MNPLIHRPAPAAVSAAVALVALGLSGCATTADPAPQAEALAQALETGEPGEARWADGATVDLDAALGDLSELPRTVEVTSVSEVAEDDDGREVADVALEWSWDLDRDDTPDWIYPVSARLILEEDGTWSTVSDRSVVAEGLRPGGSLAVKRTTGARGDVLGGGGTELVTDRAVFRVGIDKTLLEDADEAALRSSAEAVATLAGDDDPAAFADRVIAAGPKAFVEAIVVRQGSDEVDVDAVGGVPGGVALPDEIPLAPTADFARAVLGSSGPATKDVIDESEGRVAAGDVTGLSGLQQTYDAVLAGDPGLQVIESLDSGDEVVLYERPATYGQALELSLEVPVQEAAEAALVDIPAPSGMVVLRPSTGEVLAAASGPGSEGLNTAMLASVAPGSTYKVVTALALLRSGVGPDDTVSCTPEATVDGYTISNYPGYPAASLGDITLTEAIAQSCNTALVNSTDRLTAGDMAEAAEALGLNREAPNAAAGFLGSYPDDASGTGFAASLIGQGEVLASPLAMATVAASIQAGTTVTPTLVTGPADITAESGPAEPAVPLTTDEAEVLQGLMASVVTGGTANLLADVPGAPVHAKTGSAEAGDGDDARVDSWMIAAQDDVAVAVFVQGGGHGAGVAGDAVEELLRALA
ncbi:MAG: penicillin-binding transpeptidase domain-containing protein [Microthrixaceae bacterium]